MPFIGRCHICKRRIKFPDSAMGMSIGCPRCHNQFTAVPYEEEGFIPPPSTMVVAPSAAQSGTTEPAAAPHIPRPPSRATATESIHDFTVDEPAAPAWISPWGVLAFILATGALLSAALGNGRNITIILALLGLLTTLVGVAATTGSRKPSDSAWLGIGGTLSGLTALVALFAPSLINNRWAIDFAVPRPEPDKLVAVARDNPRSSGRPLGVDDWTDAASEAIRQDDVLARVETAKIVRLKSAKAPQLLIHFRLFNTGGGLVQWIGLDQDKKRPTFTDAAGQSYTFVEQRTRIPAKGDAVFEASGSAEIGIFPNRWQDWLLVFDLPPGSKTGKMDAVGKLEVPASTWGRNGTCKFTIAGNIALAPLQKK